VRIVTSNALEMLSHRAGRSARGRANLNLHPRLDDPVQRLFNAVQPGSYVRPHRHGGARWEAFVAIAGRAAILTFDGSGRVLERVELAPDGPVVAAEVAGGGWHTLAAMKAGTVLLELKPGPYSPITDKDFAPWAPAEGDPFSADLERWFRTAGPGDTAPTAGSARE